VPKQIPALGRTVNLGNPFGAFCLFAIVAAIIAVLTVSLVFLMPGAGSSKSDSFGPVIERVVEEPKAPDWNWFDLEIGTNVSAREMAASDDNDANYQWKQKHGVDLAASLDGPQSGLIAWDFISLPVNALLWDSATAETITSLVNQTRRIGKVTGLPASAKGLPATFVFKTREGGMGILQITGFTDNPPGVKIRYKLVQNSAADVAPVADDVARLKREIEMNELAIAKKKFQAEVLSQSGKDLSASKIVTMVKHAYATVYSYRDSG
jgi:hypothetical protein